MVLSANVIHFPYMVIEEPYFMTIRSYLCLSHYWGITIAEYEIVMSNL